LIFSSENKVEVCQHFVSLKTLGEIMFKLQQAEQYLGHIFNYRKEHIDLLCIPLFISQTGYPKVENFKSTALFDLSFKLLTSLSKKFENK
jgi:hypothetical protein